MANGHIKRCSASLIMSEMQIKAIVKYHFTFIGMAIFKKAWQLLAGVGLKGNPYILLLGISLTIVENNMEVFQKIENRPIRSSNSTFGYVPKGNENKILMRYRHTRVYRNIIPTGQDMQTTQISINEWWIQKLWCIFVMEYY